MMGVRVIHKTKVGKRLLSGLVAVALVAGAAVFWGPSSPVAAEDACSEVRISVAMTAGGAKNQTVAGTYCQPEDWAAAEHQIDILVHGATYNRSYWDWPQQQPQYSYVDRTLDAGRATLAFDRLGSGSSSRPLGASVTPASEAYVLHQIVQWARAQGMAEVTTVGHSFGSIAAIHEASVYDDVDRLVVTGLLHGVGLGAVVGAGTFYPAPLDPQFFGRLLDPTYLTSVPGVRGAIFYSPSVDPAVVAYDEAHKDVVSQTFFNLGLAEFGTPAPLNIANGISAPVYVISGSQDALTCGAVLDCSNAAQVQANEQPYYTGAASLMTKIIANTGHNLTLHPSAGTSFAAINQWIQTH